MLDEGIYDEPISENIGVMTPNYVVHFLTIGRRLAEFVVTQKVRPNLDKWMCSHRAEIRESSESLMNEIAAFISFTVKKVVDS